MRYQSLVTTANEPTAKLCRECANNLMTVSLCRLAMTTGMTGISIISTGQNSTHTIIEARNRNLDYLNFKLQHRVIILSESGVILQEVCVQYQYIMRRAHDLS